MNYEEYLKELEGSTLSKEQFNKLLEKNGIEVEGPSMSHDEYIRELAGSPLNRDKFDSLLKKNKIKYSIGKHDEYSFAVVNGFKGSRDEFDKQKESNFVIGAIGESDKKVKELDKKSEVLGKQIIEIKDYKKELEKIPSQVAVVVSDKIDKLKESQKEYNNKTIQNLGKKADKDHKHKATEIIGLETIVKSIEDKIEDRPTRDEVSEVLDKKFITKDNTYTKEETRKIVDDKLKKIVVPGRGGGGSSSSGGAVDSVNGQTGVVVLNQDDVLDGITYKQYSATEKTKLAGIEAGAEVNTLNDIIAGINISVDKTDPLNPIINSLSDRYKTISTTSQAIVSTGTLTFTVGADLAYTTQQDVIIAYDANNHMHGTVVSYSGTTLVVDIQRKTGSGTYASRTINLDAIEATPVTVTDSTTIDLTITSQDITASVKDGSIDSTKLSTAVNNTIAGKLDSNAPITGATKTKITYDADGLVTAGADAGISDITGLQSALDEKQAISQLVVGPSNADYITDGTSDQVQIQQAIDALSTAGGGVVFIQEGIYNIDGRITPKSNVKIVGAGLGVTELRGSVVGDWACYNVVAIEDWGIENLTFNVNNVVTGSGLGINKSTNGTFKQVEFKNGASNGRLCALGLDTATGAINCFNNKFIDCIFGEHSGTLEQMLIMNARDTFFTRCKFRGKLTGGPCTGAYQQVEYCVFDSCTWEDNVGYAHYYSLACNDIIFVNCMIDNTGGGLVGCNESDNGAFGEVVARNVKVINTTFLGGANSVATTAIQLGMTDGSIVDNCTISGFNIGIQIHNGNTATATPVRATNFSITNNKFYNNTASNTAHAINPAILFNQIGGSLYGSITGNHFYDTQGTATQRYPIVFDGAFTWDKITIANNRLSAYAGADSITKSGSAVLGADVQIWENSDFTGTQNILDNNLQLGTGGATPEMRFGDSFRMRGASGQAIFAMYFASKYYQFRDSIGNTKLFIEADTGNISNRGDVPRAGIDSVNGAKMGGLVEILNDDIEVIDPSKGIILNSPDSTRWRITIDNSGVLSSTSL